MLGGCFVPQVTGHPSQGLPWPARRRTSWGPIMSDFFLKVYDNVSQLVQYLRRAFHNATLRRTEPQA